MKRISIVDAKAHLSAHLRSVEQGETIILTRHNKPVAEMRPLAPPTDGPRPFGLCAGEFRVPEDFNAPLPPEILDAFEGR